MGPVVSAAAGKFEHPLQDRDSGTGLAISIAL